MPSLHDLEALVAAIDAGSLSGGARKLGRSLQSVSRSLASLETELGVLLIARTTRALHVTAAGARYCERVRVILQEVASARDELLLDGASLVGRLRVTASTAYGTSRVAPLLCSFMHRHPEVDIDLVLIDEFVDMAANGIDLAVRFGDLPDSALISRRVGQVSRVICASPSYLAVHGIPERPKDIANHRCVTRENGGQPDLWRFGKGDNRHEIAITGNFRCDNSSARISAIENGVGIGRVALDQIVALVADGRIQIILREDETNDAAVSLVWQPSTAVSARLRALIDYLSQRLAE